MSVKLRQFKVLTFDCYGTLINWEMGIINALKETKVSGLVSDVELLCKFGNLGPPIQKEYPTMLYPKVLENTFLQLAAELGLDSTNDSKLQEQAAAFGSTIKDWPAFPDSSNALQYLQQHYKFVILSNVDRASFAHSEAKLGVKFDLIVTAEDVGSYKPDLANFHHVLGAIKEKWGYEKEDVLHTFQSLYHDAVPANQLGLHTSHIKRARLFEESSATPAIGVPIQLDFEFPTLEAMAEAHRAEQP